MTTLHSPRRARSQIAAGITSTETATTTSEAEILRMILQELGQLREEQNMDRELIQTGLQRLKQDISQLNRSENIPVV